MSQKLNQQLSREQQIAALLEQLRLAGASNVKPFPKGGKS